MPEQPWWSWPIVVATVGGVLMGLWALINRLGGEKFRKHTMMPPTWDVVFARMDTQDTKIKERDEKIDKLEKKLVDIEERMVVRDRAFGNVLAAAARQWPKESPGPIFSKVDLDELGDTVPAEWLTNVKSV